MEPKLPREAAPVWRTARGTALWPTAACLFFVNWIAVPSAVAQALRLHGQVSDSANNTSVVGALVVVEGIGAYALTDEQGRFVVRLDTGLPQNARLRVSAVGYTLKVVSIDAVNPDPVTVALQPDPIALDGIQVDVVTYSHRLRMRRNGTLLKRRPYAIGREALAAHSADNVWDLVRSRDGFRFEGYSDYGCAVANIEGRRRVVEILINDRPARHADLTAFAPSEFALVEVWKTEGPWMIQAYTQEHLDHATMAGRRPPPLRVIPTLCPKP